MSEAPEHVCMYVCLTQSYKISLFRRVSNSLSKPFKISRLIHFFLNCEGGTSGSLARLQTCMYVCMFELQTYPKHVCMYVCMYVWQAQASMYVCMSEAFWACMYVCLRQLSVYVCIYVCLRLLSMYVCMSLTNLQNLLVSEGVKFLIKTLQNLTFNSFFFELWGGVLPGA